MPNSEITAVILDAAKLVGNVLYSWYTIGGIGDLASRIIFDGAPIVSEMSANPNNFAVLLTTGRTKHKCHELRDLGSVGTQVMH